MEEIFGFSKEKLECDVLICNSHPMVGPYDAYTYLTMGPVCLILSFMIIYTYIRFKEFRQREGDLILAITLSDLLMGIHWTMNGIFSEFTFVSKTPDCHSRFCMVNGLISTVGGTYELLYNISFVLYIAAGLKYKLTSNKIKKWAFHLVPFCIMVSVLGYGYHGKLIGITFWGTCSLSQGPEFKKTAIISVPGVVLTYLAVIFGVLWYKKRKLPEGNPTVEPIRIRFLDFYSAYLMFSLLIWTVIGAFYFLSVFYPLDIFKDCASNSWVASLYSFSKIANTFKMLSNFALALLRLTDPTLIKFKQGKREEKRLKQINGNQSLQISNDEPVFVTVSQQMQYTLQVAYTNAILSHICMVYTRSQRIEEEHNLYLSNHSIESPEYLSYRHTIGSKMVFDDEKDMIRRRTHEKGEYFSQGLDVEIHEYAPEAFMRIRKSDSLSFNFVDSMDVTNNLRRIKKAAKSDGGASGEFFFFTYDDRLIIKSVTKEELHKFIRLIPFYLDHVRKNTDSMLAKIYGLYTVANSKSNETEFNLILMRNSVSLPRIFINRIFDMKGSTVNRRVFKRGKVTEEQLRSRTMKDMDFLEYEKRIMVDPLVARRVYYGIERDSRFLERHNIMDYSLLVVKVEKDKFRAENRNYKDTSFNPDSLMSIPSVSEEGIYYHIAIIDYLQEYNFEKKMERNAKRIMKCKVNLDISSTAPNLYRERFLGFLREILGIKDF